jgi:hypothetical protein
VAEARAELVPRVANAIKGGKSAWARIMRLEHLPGDAVAAQESCMLRRGGPVKERSGTLVGPTTLSSATGLSAALRLQILL